MQEQQQPFTFSFYECIDEAGNPLHKVVEAPRNLSYRQLFFCNYVGNLTGIYDADFFGKIAISSIRKRQDWMLWLTILKKRENYYRAFDDFDPRRIATYTAEKKAELMADAGIVRNRLKIEATVLNAQAYLRMEAAGVNFSEYLWSFTGGRPQVNALKSMAEIRASSPESDAMSKALKKEGFKFVGTTICYAFMQAVGMVNDHMVDCWRYKAVAKMR